jgi:LysM repeat protein
LSGIASRFGTTTRNLMTLNGITDANRIRIGQVLTVAGTAAAPAAPAPSTPAPSSPAPTTPAPEAPAPSASGTTSYTVAAGNTLSGIAARFGTTTRNLMSLNGITDANRIRIGQVLLVAGTAAAAPAAPATTSGPTTTYTVAARDTLSGIAARFGTTTRNLMALNGITNANFLRIGQVLRLA